MLRRWIAGELQSFQTPSTSSGTKGYWSSVWLFTQVITRNRLNVLDQLRWLIFKRSGIAAFRRHRWLDTRRRDIMWVSEIYVPTTCLHHNAVVLFRRWFQLRPIHTCGS